MANRMQIKITDNSGLLLRELERKQAAILEAMGIQAETFAKLNITDAERRDTGRMINSVTHTVVGNDVYIGTNVSYALWHEIGTGIYASQPGGRQSPWSYYDRKGVLHWTRGLKPIHFLRDAVSNHIEDYKKIIKDMLKS